MVIGNHYLLFTTEEQTCLVNKLSKIEKIGKKWSRSSKCPSHDVKEVEIEFKRRCLKIFKIQSNKQKNQNRIISKQQNNPSYQALMTDEAMEDISSLIDSTKPYSDNDVPLLLQYALRIDPLSFKLDAKDSNLNESHQKSSLRRDKFVVDNLPINPALNNWKPGRLTHLTKNYSTESNSCENSKSFIRMMSEAKSATTEEKTAVSNQDHKNDDCISTAIKQPAPQEPKRFKFSDRKGGFLAPRKIEPIPHSNSVANTSYNANVAPPTRNLFTIPAIPVKSSNQYPRPNVSRNMHGVGSNVNPVSIEENKRDCELPSPQQFQFKTAYEQLAIEDRAKGIKRNLNSTGSVHVPGLLRRAANRPTNISEMSTKTPEKEKKQVSDNPEVNELMEHDCMKNVDPKMVEAILNEVVDVSQTTWEDIAGLEGVKSIIKEIIIWPMLRPDIFTGLRGPPKGILLFGPPGTGKTMIGRLISTESKSTFFNISASSLTSKWIGEGEKMVRALFQVAKVKQPAVIFIDEIDSILTQRSDTEHESSRRLKTEFLIQFDGCGTKSDDRILVIGVTNRPQELDEAARRRLVKRIYIPLPDAGGRQQLVRSLLKGQQFSLSDEDFARIADITEGYSGADVRSICQEAAYGPIRDISHLLQDITAEKVRPILLRDFECALRHVKASVATNDLDVYEDWDEKFGCHISQ